MYPTGDALSDVLRTVQLKACVYFVRDMPAPWGMDIPASATGPLHMVLHGRCLFRCAGEDIVLDQGDAIVLPRGAPHQMLDQTSTIPEPAAKVMHRLRSKQRTEITGDYTRMLCGHFEWDTVMDHPLFRELPEYIVVRNFGNQDIEHFKNIVALLTAENKNEGPGSTAITDRLGEVFFVTLLKGWMADNVAETGILAAINDERLARALRHIHHKAEQEIDIAALAQIAGMSRTSFAVRFKEAMGTTPAAYLAEWRLVKARRLLISSELPLSRVLDRVGYSTDASFARAYKRRFSESPATTRRRHKRTGSDVASSSALLTPSL